MTTPSTTLSKSQQCTGNLENLQVQRRLLPIYTAREALIREFRAHDCSVVVGETGSGKTTQIPQVGIKVNVTVIVHILNLVVDPLPSKTWNGF